MSTTIYFIGIGGIGMSALARYFVRKGYDVAGYDLTPSPLTQKLEEEGINVHYEDSIALIPKSHLGIDIPIVYTPAVPSDHKELNYFLAQGNPVYKRAQILGEITRLDRGLCVAGTHGKTTTSTMLAHILYRSSVGCNAFLGGISNNYKTNLLLAEHADSVVIEADEFDRSFHYLEPEVAIITSADPDHLDIYETAVAYRESFEHFTSLIKPGGALVMHESVEITPKLSSGVRLYRYSTDKKADFYASNIRIEKARLYFRWHYPSIGDQQAGGIDVELGVPLRINVDNATAAMAVAYLRGVSLDEISEGVRSFRGVHRRFDKVLEIKQHILIDDYAHHPVELAAAIHSVKTLYPSTEILGIFQPHLYSRTHDFYSEFAQSLDQLDQVILLDIYPARELPIMGVSSHLIADCMTTPVKVISKDELLNTLKVHKSLPQVIVMLGAGDIDRLVPEVAQLLELRS